jgi:hypothetical protein
LKDDVADVRVQSQQAPEPVLRNDVDLAIGPRDEGGDGAASGQVADLSGEVPRPVDHEHFRNVAGFVQDLDFPGLDEERGDVFLAGPHERFPLAYRRKTTSGQFSNRASEESSSRGKATASRSA